MLHSLLTFLPVAALLTLTPGAATAMVVRSATRGGRREAFFTTAGNSLGVLAWGAFAAVGIATLVATSTAAFTAVKLVGAVVLIAMGVRSLRGRTGGEPGGGEASGGSEPGGGAEPGGFAEPQGGAEPGGFTEPQGGAEPRAGTNASALRAGLLTSVANPKLAVFFVALFPQFVPRGAPVLPSALAMAALIVASDLIWYSALAVMVSRARRAFVGGPWQRRVERLTGAVLIGLGLRLALERR